MRELDQSVFNGQPQEVTLACVDYDGLLKFGKNVRNYRYTWASERWRGAEWVEKREGTDYKPLTSIRRMVRLPRRVIEALESASEALEDLGACDDPGCRDDHCNHALKKVRDVLSEQLAERSAGAGIED